MSQVSKRRLNEKVYSRVFEIFTSSLVSIKNKDRAEKFISDLLTDTEKIMLAKRLSIAFLLMKNYTYANIEYLLKVSRPTIWQVKRWMNERGQGYTIILKSIINSEETKEAFKAIFTFLAEALPKPQFTKKTTLWQRRWVNKSFEKPF